MWNPWKPEALGELELTDSSPQTSPGIHEKDWHSTGKPMGDKQQQLQEECKVLLIPIVTTCLIDRTENLGHWEENSTSLKLEKAIKTKHHYHHNPHTVRGEGKHHEPRSLEISYQ